MAAGSSLESRPGPPSWFYCLSSALGVGGFEFLLLSHCGGEDEAARELLWIVGVRSVDFEGLSRQLEKRLGRLMGRKSAGCCPLADLIGYVYISSKKTVMTSSVVIGHI